jgi:enoyl-CoA hydratase/carnithine racemase
VDSTSRNAHASIDIDAGVISLTFCRPDKRNAVSDLMLQSLEDAVDTLAQTETARVLVIRAEGPYFTAGVDLDGGLARAMAEPSSYPGQSFRRVYQGLHRLFDKIEDVEKPVILAAQGPCFGIGVELAASCDFRFAADTAVFALPEVRLGVIPGSGGTSRVTRLIGPHWTKWLTVACQQISAEQALRIGFVHDVVSADALSERVSAFATELTQLPAEALGVAKVAVDLCTDADRLTARHLERIANTPLFGSPEFLHRTSRFTQRSG